MLFVYGNEGDVLAEPVYEHAAHLIVEAYLHALLLASVHAEGGL